MAEDALQIRLAGNYGFESIERAIRDMQPLLELDEPRELEIDLGGLVFMGPTSLALLEAALKRVEGRGLAAGGYITHPRSQMTKNYLQRMDLFSGLADLVAEIPVEDFTRREPVGFRPCQQFGSPDDYWRVASELSEALRERCNVDDTAFAAIRICLDELAENVVHHADSTIGGFAAAQGNPRRNRFEVGIVDLGIGFRASLAKNPDIPASETDHDAIETALRPFVTSTPDRNAGIGLFVTRRLLKANGGVLLVRSGLGRMVAGERDGVESAEVSMPGAVVALRARTDRPLDIGAVYEEVEHERDNGRDNDQPG